MEGFFSSSLFQKQRPLGLVPKCGACGLFKHCHTPKMPVYGKGGERVLIISDFPSKEDDEEGIPFQNEAGSFFRDTLARIGVDWEEDTWTTHALICRLGVKAFDPKSTQHCLPNLINTLETLKPRVVITLGRMPLASLLKDIWKGVKEVDPWVGWKIPYSKYWICPTFSPFNVFTFKKNDILRNLFVRHLETAFEITEEPKPAKDWKSKIRVILDDKEAFRALRQMHERGNWVAVDYETNCLKPEWSHAKLYSFAASDKEETISFPWHGKAIEGVGYLLKSSRTRKIASNLKMEERWTQKEFGHGVSNWGWDTMLATHCLDNRPGICSLKFQCLVQLGIPLYNEHIEPFLESDNGHYNQIHKIDLGQLLLYGGQDALYERVLARLQRKLLGY